MPYTRLLGGLILCLYSMGSLAFEPFNIEDIRLEGLRRISTGTVFNYFPLQVNEKVTQEKTSQAINALFKTGLFKDVRLSREGNVLVVKLEERPAIFRITFSGNEELEEKQLLEALKGVEFAQGRVFNPALLDQVELQIKRQYFNLGKYAVEIHSTMTPLSRNRVGIHFSITEGEDTEISRITFVGNKAFSDDELLDEMELSTGGWFSWIPFLSDNKYSKQKLAADLETIRSFYLDQGYINFSVDSTQVSITPDKKRVYITINVNEGNKYTISDIKLTGNLILEEKALREQIAIKPGDTFSRKKITKSIDGLTQVIGNEGYFRPNINPLHEFNEEQKTVVLNFAIDPGKRVYVRRINFLGNTKTRDEVLRREMRQMEGGWISTGAIERSKVRLERLSYFDNIDVETKPVSGTQDLVDVNYSVEERPLGSVMAGFGYSQTYGFAFNASIVQDNFLGTGKRIGFAFNNSKVNRVYKISYLNPYVNVDGVSRGFDLFYRTTDAEEANLSRYVTDSFGGVLDYGIPITEFNSIRLGMEADHTKLKTTEFTAEEVFNFIDEYGEDYNSFRLTAGWASDTRNSIFFPNQGMLNYLRAEVALPFSDLDYYKISYIHQSLYPIVSDYVFSLRGEVGYGEGYGDTEGLPFFENYTAGGPRSVRGFRENTLGPLDSYSRPFGGNLKVVGNAEVILPLPFTKNINNFRLSAFVDGGNVYSKDEDFDTSLFRYSTGLAAIWISPIGPMTFSIAKPLNEKEGDETQLFQFTIGTIFY